MQHAALRKLSMFGFIGTSFLMGWRFGGSLPMGVFFASFWFIWPWYELITRVRKIAMPVDQPLRPKSPPNRETFPALVELTDEIEGEGFEHVADLGRDWDGAQQFYRTFRHEAERTQAALCVVEQGRFAFFYIRIVSRGTDGRGWCTWNYPFSLNLKLAPEWQMNRENSEKSFWQLLESHRAFLAQHGIATDTLEQTTGEEWSEQLEAEQQQQIAHNLTAGILARHADGAIRYTWRGLLFIWLQFLRDFVRLS
jgi:hypothetical protein